MKDFDEILDELNSRIKDPHGGVSCYHLKADLLYALGLIDESKEVVEDLAIRWGGDRRRAYFTMSMHMFYRNELGASFYFINTALDQFPLDDTLVTQKELIINELAKRKIHHEKI